MHSLRPSQPRRVGSVPGNETINGPLSTGDLLTVAESQAARQKRGDLHPSIERGDPATAVASTKRRLRPHWRTAHGQALRLVVAAASSRPGVRPLALLYLFVTPLHSTSPPLLPLPTSLPPPFPPFPILLVQAATTAPDTIRHCLSPHPFGVGVAVASLSWPRRLFLLSGSRPPVPPFCPRHHGAQRAPPTGDDSPRCSCRCPLPSSRHVRPVPRCPPPPPPSG